VEAEKRREEEERRRKEEEEAERRVKQEQARENMNRFANSFVLGASFKPLAAAINSA